MSTELVRVTIDERDVHVPKGTGLVETALAAGVEIPVFCYEPRLGAPIGACRMCLVEVEGMPKLQAGCTLTAQDGMVVQTARTSRAGGRGTERDARVHPRQPPARLPGLRQGRRVPAAGPHLPLRPRQHADELREAHLREADPDLAHDLARPRALHPLLPLHALQRERLGGRPARRREPRRAVGDHDLRGPALHGRVHRQRDRALPGRRAPADAVPLRGAAVGDRRRADGLRPLPGRLQRQRDRARGEGQADPLPQPPGDRRGLDLRQGPLRVHAPARRGPARAAAAAPAPARSRGGLVGAGDRRGRAAAARGARARRHRALGLRDGRAGVRAREAAARRARLAPGDAAGGGLRRARRLPAAALRDPRRRRRRRARRRAGRRARAGRRPLDPLRAAQRRPDPRRRERSGGRRGGAGRPRLVGPRRPRRRDRRQARREARARRPRGLRRLLPPRDAERPRGRRRLGRLLRRGGRGGGLDRPARGLGRRGGGGRERPRARRAGGGDDRDLDVRRARRRLGRPHPAGDGLPRARRHVRQPRGPPAAAAPHGRAAVPRRARVDLAARRAVRRRRGAVRRGRLRRGLRARLRRALVRRGRRAGAAARLSRRTGARRARAPAGAAAEGEARGDPARRVQAALLRRGRRARHGASVPATAARARALGRGRAAAQDRDRRPRHGRLQRQRDHAAGPRQPPPARGHRTGRARARERPRRASSRSRRRRRWSARERALVDRADRGADHRQHPARALRLPDADRAEGDGADAAPLRPEPRRQVRAAPADRRPRQAHPQGGVLAGVTRSSCRTSSRRSSRPSPRSPPSRSSRSGPAGR